MKKLFKINLILLLLTLFHFNMKAQQIITIPIETKDNSMVLQTDKDNHLGIIHFGKKLLQNNDNALIAKNLNLIDSNGGEGVYNNAYTPSGTWNIVEPAIRITHSDGNTSLDLKYVSHETKKIDDNVSQVIVLLKDPVYPVEVTLCYKIYAKENVVEQWSIIKHQEKANVLLNKFASANLYMMSDNFYLHHYHGEWAREMKPEETKLSHGIHTLDSKLGTRADLLQAPTFMLSFDRPATEDEGKVMLANLA
jgi:alpha-galactosidase